MSFKRHTENFLIYRNSELKYPRNLKYESLLQLQEEGGEIPLNRLDLRNHDEEFSSQHAPPTWILRIHPIEQNIQIVEEKLKTLEKLHKENLITRFGEDKQYDRNIETLTSSISQLFHMLKEDIKKLSRFEISNKKERFMRDNIQTLLVSNLRNLSLKLNRIQTGYLTHLQRKEKKMDITSDDEDDNQINEDYLSRYDTGFTNEQQLRKDISIERIKEREMQINRIASMTNEVAEMFEDVAEMVNEQGTLFDRIDYNIDTSIPLVAKGVQDIEEVVNKGSTFSKRLCVLLIAIIIAGSVIVGILASKGG